MKTTIRYRVPEWHDEIRTIEVIRETEKQLVYRNAAGREQRENKDGYGQQSFRTWTEAHAYLLARARRRLEAARVQLSKAHGALGQIKGMKQP